MKIRLSSITNTAFLASQNDEGFHCVFNDCMNAAKKCDQRRCEDVLGLCYVDLRLFLSANSIDKPLFRSIPDIQKPMQDLMKSC